MRVRDLARAKPGGAVPIDQNDHEGHLSGPGKELFMVAIPKDVPIRVVSAAAFQLGGAQTRGFACLAAVAPQLGTRSASWGGLIEVEPGARTGIHHHGMQQTVAYVLSGVCDLRWGAKGEHVARAKAGELIHVPPCLPHMEINPSDSEPCSWVVLRSSATPIVVNLPDHTWPWQANPIATGSRVTFDERAGIIPRRFHRI